MSADTESGSRTGERIATFDLAAVRRFADVAVKALSDAREEIDALNVFPVPDGDTGTNMYLTMDAARDALAEHLAGAGDEPDLRAALQVYARGALLGARGNSGVILSQLIGALLRRMGQGEPDDRSAALFAEGMVLATEAAYAAVGEPVEGTMLSVAKAATLAAVERAKDPDAHLGDVLAAASGEARAALARTPDQMQLLRDAGVVDAGGRGLCVILDAAETAVTGHRPVGAPAPMVAIMPVLPVWGKLKAVAHTLPYDLSIVVPFQQGRALPEDEYAGVTAPTLVIAGGKSPAYMKNAQAAIAGQLPQGTLRELPGQTHMIRAKVVAPVVADFLAG